MIDELDAARAGEVSAHGVTPVVAPTLMADAERAALWEKSATSGPAFKLHHDPRITPLSSLEGLAPGLHLLGISHGPTLAFKDIAPKAPVHLLLIPKAHCAGLNDLTPEVSATLPHLMATAATLAKEHGVAESGWRLVSNCGPDAGQMVFHLHFHLMGGRKMGVGRSEA